MLPTATTTSPTISPTASLSAGPLTGCLSKKDAAVLSPKRKRRPAGTPDPDAEVVALSPRTLLESDRYVCDICGQGFQRDQNLQMHRRRHKVPWKLLKKDHRSSPPVTAAEGAPRKRVFVCPEPTCLHNDARHALGDLVGIKKHFRRKHSHHKQWVCEKCSKAYAVQSDFKAHLKTCGTRGHSCDCGRVFSRVESFIEHQDSCTAGSARGQPLPELQPLQVTPACPPGTTASSASQYSISTDPNFGVAASRTSSPLPPMHGLTLLPKLATENLFFSPQYQAMDLHHNLELRLQVPSSSDISTDHICFHPPPLPPQPLDVHRNLALTIGTAVADEQGPPATLAAADEARRAARRQIEMAEVELANAKRIRQQAKAELESAELLREEATRKLNSTVMQITCHACKRHFRASSTAAAAEDETTSIATSYVSSATTEGDGDL